jgi:iron(III) transport system ATP-binding protein
MLLDEPFASIDGALRQRLRAEMRRMLKMRSTPSILVTHDPNEAIEVGDRIAVMRNGRIVETASPEVLYLAPKTVAGAAIFPGSQTLACHAADGGVGTAFGVIAPIRRPADAAHVVIHDGGVHAAAEKDSPFLVIDCRFAGPHWLATLANPAQQGAQIKGCSAAALEIGAAASVRIDPALTRVLAS